jgi:hypothetical protein
MVPSTITNCRLREPVQYGAVPPPAPTLPFGSVDNAGYFVELPTNLNYGAAVDDGNGCPPSANMPCNALLVQQETAEATLSLYAIGVAGDTNYPQRGLICDEDPGVAGILAPVPQVCPPGSQPAQGSQLLIPCCPTALSTISVDVYNTSLYGPGAPDNPQREQRIGPVIGQRTSDVICLLEVDAQQWQSDIITATASAYPNTYSIPTTNAGTPFTDPKNQSGQTPAAPTQAPCAFLSQVTIDNAIQCGEMSCSTQTAADDGGAAGGTLAGGTACISENCAGPFINVQAANSNVGIPGGPACFDCLINEVAGNGTWADAANVCTTVAASPLAFDGESSVMILSRVPLMNTDSYILPSTLFRRTVLYAQLQLSGGQSVDFYCGGLTSTFNGENLPYIGDYGGGADASTPEWENENLWQAQKLIAWVGTKSGSNPAIVVGDWRSSLGAGADAGAPPEGGVALQSQAPATMQLFQNTSGWSFAVGPNAGTTPWVPQCNFCPGVEDNGPSESYFVVQPMLVNWPNGGLGATTSESLIFTDSVDLGGDAGKGPLSPYYGVNIQVVRP